MSRRVLRAVALCLALHCIGVSRLHAEWVTRNGDAAQRGYVPVSIDFAKLKVDWSIGYSGNYIAIADGRVVLSSSGSTIEGFDVNTGERLWRTDGKYFHEMTIMDGSVYVATGQHSASCGVGVTCDEKPYLRRFDLEDGHLIRRMEFQSQWYSGWGPVPHNGALFMEGGYFGGLYTFGPSGTGGHLDLPNSDEWQPAVDDKFIYVFGDGSLHLVDREQFKLVRSIQSPINVGRLTEVIPIIGDDNDVFVRVGRHLISFDVAHGNANWSKSADFGGQPVYNDGTLYAVSAGALSAIDAATGEPKWGWSLAGTQLGDRMLLTDSHILVTAKSGTYAINLLTHQTDWHVPQSRNLAFSDGRLFIGGTAYLAVPEPQTIMLAAICFSWLGFVRRRDKQ